MLLHITTQHLPPVSFRHLLCAMNSIAVRLAIFVVDNAIDQASVFFLLPHTSTRLGTSLPKDIPQLLYTYPLSTSANLNEYSILLWIHGSFLKYNIYQRTRMMVATDSDNGRRRLASKRTARRHKGMIQGIIIIINP